MLSLGAVVKVSFTFCDSRGLARLNIGSASLCQQHTDALVLQRCSARPASRPREATANRMNLISLLH